MYRTRLSIRLSLFFLQIIQFQLVNEFQFYRIFMPDCLQDFLIIVERERDSCITGQKGQLISFKGER